MDEEKPVKVKLLLSVDGKKVFEKEDDLLTRNFNRFITLFLSGIKLALKRKDGTDVVTPDTIYWTEFRVMRKIAIGLDSTPPSGLDYKLNEPYMETDLVAVRVVEETPNYIIIDASGNFSFTEDKTIYEFGLFGRYTGHDVLMARDVVPDGIPVTGGQVLTITYRFIVGTYP